MMAALPLARAQDVVVPYVAPRAANTLVMLPDGSTVHVELALTEAEQQYGLMGRTRLPEGRGMLFVHDGMAKHPYWMYHCKIGLDIVWMDARAPDRGDESGYAAVQGEVVDVPELRRA